MPRARLMVTRLRPLGVQRLAQHLQRALAELGQLVQEQHPTVGQALRSVLSAGEGLCNIP